jgi:hypothetical protein
MNIGDIIGHLAFGLIAFSFLVKDIFWLRIMSIAASLFSIFYNYFIPAEPMMIAIFWNGVFIAVNLYHIAMFKSMSPVEFLKITKIAKWKKFKKNAKIITQSKPVKDLHLIYNGTVDVVVGIEPVAELKDGQFVGEMSFLTEKPATATCVVKHDTECLVWNQTGFKDLLKRNPSLYFSIQSLLSAQVSDALVNSSKKIS